MFSSTETVLQDRESVWVLLIQLRPCSHVPVCQETPLAEFMWERVKSLMTVVNMTAHDE